MRRFMLIILFILPFWMAKPVHALLKIDIGGSSAEITKTISGYLENAKKKMDESVAVQTAIIYGKGAVETAKQLKEMKEKAEGKINAIKEDPLGAGLDAAGELAEKTGLTESEQYQKAMEKIDEKTEDFQKLTDLEEQKEKLTDKINEQIAAEEKTTQSKIDALTENNKNLQKMIEENPDKAEEYKKQISKNEAEIQALQVKLEATKTRINSENLGSLTDLTSQVGALKNKAEGMVNAAKDKAKQQLLDKLGSMDNGKALNETVSKNYIPEGGVENMENINKIKSYRTYVAAQDMLDVFARAAVIKQGLDDENTESENIANRTGTLDGSTAAINMNTQVVIKNIEALSKYIEVMLLDMKMRTSRNLSEIESTLQQDAPDDITSFNLDNYIYVQGNTAGEK